jgi:DNA-binding transcriptional regulator YiaG
MTGPQLRKIRDTLGLTQRQLADRLGVHWNSVARWERDEVRIAEPVARLVRMLAQPHSPRRREK